MANTSLPTFSPEDFKDPTLFRVNSILKDYFGRVASLYQPGANTSLGATLIVPLILSPQQISVPISDDALITLGTAKKLFSPANTRQASLSGAFKTGSTTVIPVQPLPNSGSGGSGPTPPASTTTIEEFTLTAPTTMISPATAAVVGYLLFVFVTQDATGGRQITWDVTVKNAIVNIETTASTYSVFQFLGRTDPADAIVKWFACEIPLTGQAP